MMFTTRSTAVIIALTLFAGLCPAEKPERPKLANGEVTVITSETLTYDSAKQMAIFEKDVVVTDPNMKMMAEKLSVKFDGDNQVTFIRAEGDVYMEQEDKTAWAAAATYDLESGKVVLLGSPIVRQGKDMLQGEKITFWRDETRMVCEPNARLTIFSQDDKVRSQLKGKN
jgi:lipopolysaccharide transport protein LptA